MNNFTINILIIILSASEFITDVTIFKSEKL